MNRNTFRKIAVGISGGVDSAVSALRLKQNGFDVIGVFMKNWDSDEDQCEFDADIEDAQWVCDKLRIPFHEVNFVKEYWTHVFQPMLEDYKRGLTPNPDMLCNSNIKFNSFFHHCRTKLNVDGIAMGHYVRSSYGTFLEDFNPEKPVKLLRGIDESKDQSFFLSRISQEALRRTMFPVGALAKSEVKHIAQRESLDRVLNKKESMGICFIGKRNFKKFMTQYVPDRPGRFINVDTGDVVGEHSGIHLYTIGQRSQIGGVELPYYVVHRDYQFGDIYVAAGDDHPALSSRSLLLGDEHWIVKKSDVFIKTKILKCKFRFLHRRPLKDCYLVQLADGGILLDVDEPIYAAAPGQYAVFYVEDECLGSAQILHGVRCESFADCLRHCRQYYRYPKIMNLFSNYARITIAKKHPLSVA